MSVLFQTVVNTGKICSYRNTIGSSRLCKYLINRKYSDVPRKFPIFDEIVDNRRAEARRSIVVQVNSDSSFNELYNYCSKYGDINGIHHYKNSTNEHFMLIEFKTEGNLKDVLQSCSAHQKDFDIMALQSPFLWFRAVQGRKDNTKTSKSLIIKEGCVTVEEDDLFTELSNCTSMTEQIQKLYDKTKLNDLGIRLRYMVARQLEIIFKSLYANIVVRPFGSSVNGFGKMGCDLDLVLTNVLTDNMSDVGKRLVFQEKKCEGGRSPWQRHLELVAELIELRVAGASRVQRILHARVPIVKFSHEFTNVECDLCYSNMSGVYMSELLWLYGTADPRVRPLVFAIRRWAKTAGLTNIHPGRWITNFPLTLMVLFFLQQKKRNGQILPAMKTLIEKAGKNDIRMAEENINCTFLRDMNKLPPSELGQNDADLGTLLMQFFEFYAQFDFQDKAISIIEGAPVRKPSNLPLYIVNPLEQSLNVSRNVSYEECERLKLEIRNAAWQLEGCSEETNTEDWGLLGLIEQKSARSLKRILKAGNSHRLVSVKDLFAVEESTSKGEGVKEKLQRLTKKSNEGSVNNTKNDNKPKPNRMKFKNSQVAKEVYRIRKNKML